MKLCSYLLFLIVGGGFLLPGTVFSGLSPRPGTTPSEEEAPLYQYHHARSLISREEDPRMYQASRKLWEEGESLKKAGRYGAALGKYDDLLDDYPDSPFAPRAQWQYALGLERKGKLYAAFRAFQKYLDDYPGQGDLGELLKHQYQIGVAFLEGRKRLFLFFRLRSGLPTAIEIFRQVVANATFSKYSPLAQYNLALALQRQGKYEEAEMEYDLVRKNYPRDDILARTIFQLGVCAYHQALKANYDQRNDRKAIAYFSKFVRRYPDHPQAEEARKLLRKLLDRQADKAFRIARFYEKKGSPEGARIYYQEVVDNYSDSSLAAEASKKLKELREDEGE